MPFIIGSTSCSAEATTKASITGQAIVGAGGKDEHLEALASQFVSALNERVCLSRPCIRLPIQRSSWAGLAGTLSFGIVPVVRPVIGGSFSQSTATRVCGSSSLFAFEKPPYICDCFPSSGFDFKGLKLSAAPKLPFRIWELDHDGAVLSSGILTCIFRSISFGVAVYASNSGETKAVVVIAGCLVLLESSTPLAS